MTNNSTRRRAPIPQTPPPSDRPEPSPEPPNNEGDEDEDEDEDNIANRKRAAQQEVRKLMKKRRKGE